MTSQERLLQKLAKKAGLSPDTWCEEGTVIRRTKWVHLVENSQHEPSYLQLRRLRPVEQPQVNRENVERAAKYALDRLLAVQDPAGFYLYKYHPFKERSASGPSSLVRQAGCAYAMAWGAEYEHDETHAQILALSAIRAVSYLLSFTMLMPSGGMYLHEPGKESASRGKLGTIALTLLALQRGPLSKHYQKQRHELVTAILGLQEANGAFRCYTDSTSVAQDGMKQDFYPGESLLALCCEARAGSKECLEATERAFPWYRDHFKRRPTTAFVLWHVDTWRLLFEWCDHIGRQSPRNPAVYANFVFEMVDWLLQFQMNRAALHPDFIGGFARPGEKPGFSSATYIEAVIRAYGLAVCLLDTDRMQRYRRAALTGLQFLFRLQIAPETAFLFRNPAHAIGGTTRDLADFTIRCDYDQHAITAFLAALETPGLMDGDFP